MTFKLPLALLLKICIPSGSACDIESLLTFPFGDSCSVVPLKRSFFAGGTEKMVPVIRGPTHAKFSCLGKAIKRGDREKQYYLAKVPVTRGPT